MQPPTLEASIMTVVKAKGLKPAPSATKKMTGMNIIMVQTLSRIIEKRAIRAANRVREA